MKLDKNQMKAVTTSHDKSIVVACAGSGKTRVLTERIRYLVTECNVNPANIVAITLTNQAADEISSRLYDVQGINNMFIGTIHSMAYNILRALGYDFKILTDELDYQLHLEMIEKYAKYLTAKEYKKYKTDLLSYKLGLIDERTLLNSISYDSIQELHWMEDAPTEKHPTTLPVLYESRNIIQFDDLLRFVINGGAEIHIEHLLVDEFQDIGSLEYNFINSLNANNLFYVGDDWQSIYSFRGSNLEIFKSLYKDPKYNNFILSNNYRSSKSIVEMSNKIIANSNNRIKKSVNCISEDTGTIKCVPESQLVNVLAKINEEGNFRDWFILARSNKDVVYLQQILQMEGVPYSIFRREGMSGNDIKIMMFNNTVKLMTIHASKGLESDNVIIYGDYNLNTNNLSNKLQDEEIRVFYVAVTRARKNLVIITKDSFKKKINLSNYVSTKVDNVLKLNTKGVQLISGDSPEGLKNSMLDKIKSDLDSEHYDEAAETELNKVVLPTFDSINDEMNRMYKFK